MERAEYLFWYEWAKTSIDVNKISEHYLENQEVLQDCKNYISKEKYAWDELEHGLTAMGLDRSFIETVMYRYGSSIQNIYMELGLKIGARLGAENLL